MTKSLQILDCTLRDGGYTNNWFFQEIKIANFLKNIACAGLDFVECGYLNYNVVNDKNRTIFCNLDNITQFVPISNKNTKLAFMVNFGDFPISKLLKIVDEKVFLRIAFYKQDKKNAIEYCKKLKENGLNIFINPMYSENYTNSEFLDLLNDVNEIEPFAFSIVDSFGTMGVQSLINFYRRIDSTLKQNISLCFHSHNNLQQSFSNAQFLINENKNRNLIIDASVCGMGRGAGNLCTELILNYSNTFLNKTYNLEPILDIIEELVSPIHNQCEWGYSVPYFIAAINCCHPNYVRFLVEKNLSIKKINFALNKLQREQKVLYDEKVINNILLEL